MPDVWEDELHNVIQMSFATTAPMSSQDVDGINFPEQISPVFANYISSI